MGPADEVDDAVVVVAVRMPDLASVRWPARPLVGDGEPRPARIRVSYSLLSPAVVEVPLGAAGVARADRVRRLVQRVPRVVFPLFGLLLVAGFGCLALGSGVWWLILTGSAVVVAAFFLTAPVVAVTSKAPRVSGEWLVLPDAHRDVARELVRLNPGRAEIR
jgi:hypothetical protein